MMMKIIAIILIICLTFATISYGNPLRISFDEMSNKEVSNETLARQAALKTRMSIGVTVGLIGTGIVIANTLKLFSRRPDKGITAGAIGLAIIGFAYAFINWAKL